MVVGCWHNTIPSRVHFVGLVKDLWHTCQFFISHTWTGHVTPVRITVTPPLCCVSYLNASYHTCEWVMSLIRIGDILLFHCRFNVCQMWMSETCGWVMSHRDTSPLHYRLTVSHLGMSHVSRVTESRYTCGWVMPHMWIGQVTQGYNIDPPTIRARADRRRFLGTYVEAFFFF